MLRAKEHTLHLQANDDHSCVNLKQKYVSEEKKCFLVPNENEYTIKRYLRIFLC